MIWLAFVGIIGLCAATTVAITAARRTRSASHALEHLTLTDGYPDVGGVGSPLLLVAGVGAGIVSALLVAYSLQNLDGGGAPPNLLGQGAFSANDPHAESHAPTGPLKLPRQATIPEVARDQGDDR